MRRKNEFEKIYHLTELGDEAYECGNHVKGNQYFEEAHRRMEKIGFDVYNEWLCTEHREEVRQDFIDRNGYDPFEKRGGLIGMITKNKEVQNASNELIEQLIELGRIGENLKKWLAERAEKEQTPLEWQILDQEDVDYIEDELNCIGTYDYRDILPSEDPEKDDYRIYETKSQMEWDEDVEKENLKEWYNKKLENLENGER